MSVKSIAKKAFKANVITEEEYKQLLCVINYYFKSLKPPSKWLHPYKIDIACECSNCHMQMPITDYFNYCPNCGACMIDDGRQTIKI